jgi:hypothetical protein
MLGVQAGENPVHLVVLQLLRLTPLHDRSNQKWGFTGAE